MAEAMLTLKEMCDKYNVTPRTLRYYEYIELLSPHREGRTRFFGPREEARLKLILNGRRFGFQLEQIRQWLEMYKEDKDNRSQNTAWVQLATDQIDELEGRKQELEDIIDELTKLRNEYADKL
ncbi:MAG: MerR family DNA-binding transcriptional regulator [Pseudomonadota bacterium]